MLRKLEIDSRYRSIFGRSDELRRVGHLDLISTDKNGCCQLPIGSSPAAPRPTAWRCRAAGLSAGSPPPCCLLSGWQRLASARPPLGSLSGCARASSAVPFGYRRANHRAAAAAESNTKFLGRPLGSATCLVATTDDLLYVVWQERPFRAGRWLFKVSFYFGVFKRGEKLSSPN